jgi:signal transduction histidine kinase
MPELPSNRCAQLPRAAPDVTPSEDGRRTFPASRLAGALAGAALLAALASHVHLSRRHADPQATDRFLADQLGAVERRAAQLEKGLTTRAAAAASSADARAALQGQRTALSRLFGSLEKQTAPDDRIALAIRGLPLAVVAWSGPVSEMRGLDDGFLKRGALFVLAGSVTTSLVAAAAVPGPPQERHGVATAEIVVRAQRNIRNEYLADYDLLADGLPGVEVQYLDARDPAPSPFAPLEPGVVSRTATLRSSQGSLLAMVRVSAAGRRSQDDILRLRYRRVELSLGLLALVLWVFAPSVPRGRRRFRLLVGATAGRLLLLGLGPAAVPWATAALAATEVYSSRGLGPFLLSPLDLLATVAWLGVVAAVVLDLTGSFEPSRPSAWRTGFAIFLSVTILSGCFQLVADTVSHTQLDLAAITLVPQSLPHLVLHGALLLILAVTLLLITAAFSLAGPPPKRSAQLLVLVLLLFAIAALSLGLWTPPARELPSSPALALGGLGLILGLGRSRWRPWFEQGDTGVRTAAALGLTAFLAVLVYPSVIHYAEAGRRRQIEAEYAPLVLDQPFRRARALEQSRQTVDEMRLLESDAEASLSAVEDLAFAVWSASELAEAAASSAVEIQDAQGAVISRFALSLPSLAATGPPQALPRDEAWRTSRETLSVATAERPVLHASRLLVYAGRTRGAVHLYVGEDLSALPFLAPRDPYSALYRTSPGSFLRAQPLALLAYDKSANPVFSSAERPPSLAPDIQARIARSPHGSWTTLSVESGPAETYVFTDGNLIFGLGFPRLTLVAYAAGLLEGAVALTLLVVLLLAVVMVVRTVLGRDPFSIPALVEAIRRRFALRLFVAFVTLAVVPVAVLDGVVRHIVTRRLQHAAEDQALERAAVAQKAVEDFALFQRREAAGTRPVTDAALVWVASLIRNDLDVFGGGRLIASSKRELYASGLLPSRVSGSVFKDLVLDQAPSALRAERIGAFSSLVASVPVRLEGPEPAVLSIPLALRQRELQTTLDELDRTIRLSSLAFLVFAAALAHSMSRRISEPLRALTAATRRIADGDLGARVVTTNRDEILALVESFNQMAGDLDSQRRDLERSNRLAAWAEMARQVAHEVKNPLTPIQLSAEHLRRVYKDKTVDFDSTLLSCVETILKQVRTLRGIVTEFSAFARPPGSALALLDIAAVVRSVLAPYADHLAPTIALDLEAPDDLPLVRMDRRLVERALVNIVENALQAVHEGGRVSVRLSADRDSRRVSVEVADSGPGMEPETRERAFEPFFSTKTNGSGLGLALVKKIAEDHEGGVSIDSGPGSGTRVLLWLPAGGLQ